MKYFLYDHQSQCYISKSEDEQSSLIDTLETAKIQIKQ